VKRKSPVIPSHATVIGGDNETLEYFRPTLDWSVSNPGLPAASRLENGSDATYRTIYAVSSLTNPYEIFPYNIERWDGLVFGDYGAFLPASNNDFGRKGVTMTFGGGNVHTTNVEVFYPATGKRHPDTTPPFGFWFVEGGSFSVKVPNWFYYYWQAHGDDTTIEYTLRDKSFYRPGGQYVYIADDVINGHWDGVDGRGRRWETYIPDEPYTPTCRIVAYQSYGIDAFERAVAHERRHKEIYESYHAMIEQAEQDGETLTDPNDDIDNDGLPNWVEWMWGTDPDEFNTTGFGVFSDGGDNELLANLAEQGVLGTKANDWSDLGLNKGTPRERILSRVARAAGP
jgi:hypothetical protein